MNRLEVFGTLIILAAIATATLWVLHGLATRRRRIPERLEPVDLADLARRQNEINRLQGMRRSHVELLSTAPGLSGVGFHVPVEVVRPRYGAFAWPWRGFVPDVGLSRENAGEPVRAAFADFLAGGPDYCAGRDRG